MAWRPHRYLIRGELDNTQPERVTGWMDYVGLSQRVTFDLEGNFHRDIRGAAIQFLGYATPETDVLKATDHMKSFSLHQTGRVGDITAGLPPRDYGAGPYIEWYGKENGRVVLELDRHMITVVGTPIPYIESDPIADEQQTRDVNDQLRDIAESLRQEEQKRREGPDGPTGSNTDAPPQP